ncbi:hypothetical protein C8J57DRAFT_1249433 [Mycena rebaudengoi]|nr:hypothetical protein C8J57DRAFT_1249433 [Mycena rebaudengoi]
MPTGDGSQDVERNGVYDGVLARVSYPLRGSFRFITEDNGVRGDPKMLLAGHECEWRLEKVFQADEVIEVARPVGWAREQSRVERGCTTRYKQNGATAYEINSVGTAEFRGQLIMRRTLIVDPPSPRLTHHERIHGRYLDYIAKYDAVYGGACAEVWFPRYRYKLVSSLVAFRFMVRKHKIFAWFAGFVFFLPSELELR